MRKIHLTSIFISIFTCAISAQAFQPNMYYGSLSAAAHQDIVATIDYLETKIRAFNDSRITQALNTLTKGMPLSHALPLYATPEDKHTQAQRDKCIYSLAVNEKWLYWLSQDGQDFWLCHELMHILLNHLETRSIQGYKMGTTSPAYVALCREQEKEADIYAAHILGTTRGALEFIRFYHANVDLATIAYNHTDLHPWPQDRYNYLLALN